MQLTFLGTSAGTPTKTRNVTALALAAGRPRQWYLIDCGEGTQHRLLHTPLSMMQLRAIFITHVHGDHTFGLPGLLTSASMLGRTAPLYLVAPRPIRTFVETVLANSDSSLSFELRYVDSESPDCCWQDDTLTVTTTPLSHRVSCHAFIFTERNPERRLRRDRLLAEGIAPGPAWGELQKGRDLVLGDGRVLRAEDYTDIARPPRKIVVAGDNDTPELLTDACAGAQVLVHEATYTQAVADRVGPWPQHSSATQVARFAQAVQMPNLVLTHFSSRYQERPRASPNIRELEDEARQWYQGNLFLARDLASFRLSRKLAFTPDTPAPRQA